MEYRQLGGSGLMVPALSFGTGTFGGTGALFSSWGSTNIPEATRLVDLCLEVGLNLFDSADGYSGGLAEEIRYLGCSNFSSWHLMKSLAVSEKYGLAHYVAHQAYYSLIGRDYEWDLLPLGADQEVGAVVWSPLGWGRLTGKIRRGAPPPRNRVGSAKKYPSIPGRRCPMNASIEFLQTSGALPADDADRTDIRLEPTAALLVYPLFFDQPPGGVGGKVKLAPVHRGHKREHRLLFMNLFDRPAARMLFQSFPDHLR